MNIRDGNIWTKEHWPLFAGLPFASDQFSSAITGQLEYSSLQSAAEGGVGISVGIDREDYAVGNRVHQDKASLAIGLIYK